jgi:ABC-type phosphate transport system permease subunit
MGDHGRDDGYRQLLQIPSSLFDPSHTISSGIASQFPEASAGVFVALDLISR